MKGYIIAYTDSACMGHGDCETVTRYLPLVFTNEQVAEQYKQDHYGDRDDFFVKLMIINDEKEVA